MMLKAGGVGGGAPSICKHLYHGFWAFENQPAWRQQNKRGGCGGAAPPPIWKHLYHGFWVFENQPAWRKQKRGGFGGAQPPPFANTFITGSERVHMGSVFAGAKILEATLRRAFGICRLLI